MVVDLIDKIAAAQTPDGVLMALSDSMASRDVAYYSHRTIVTPKQTINHTTIPPEWLDHYFSEQYFEYDPGIHQVKTARGPICMSFDPGHPTYHAQGAAKTMFNEMQSFDARGSFFVPFQTPGDRPNASVNFLTDLSGPEFDEWVDRTGPSLALIATLAHTRIFDLIDSGEGDDANPLAPREQECLCWLAAGLRVDRIAEKMAISPRTVEFHLKSARIKLDAQTREHALAKALVAGLINL